MSRIAKHLILFLATLLLAFIISGSHGTLIVYFGYFCFGYAVPAFLLRGRHETAALVLWAVLITLFAYVFEADRMLEPGYRPSADGWAVLFSVPILGVVLRFVFLLIDRLSRPEAARIVAEAGAAGEATQADKPREARKAEKSPEARKAYNPREAHLAPVTPATPPLLRTGKAYRRLLGVWFLWPLAMLLLAFLDGDRWDRMRYDNTLLLGMFVPPLLGTAAFIAYRLYRDRKQARIDALKAGEDVGVAPEVVDLQTHGTSAG